MDEAPNYNTHVPQIRLDDSGPIDKKVVAMYIGYGVLMTGVAFFFGSLIEKRLVNRANRALLDDWLQRHNETSGDEA